MRRTDWADAERPLQLRERRDRRGARDHRRVGFPLARAEQLELPPQATKLARRVTAEDFPPSVRGMAGRARQRVGGRTVDRAQAEADEGNVAPKRVVLRDEVRQVRLHSE